MGVLRFEPRWPSDEPFSAAPPLDGAGNPNDLAGNTNNGPVSTMEVGIIVGVVLAVTILLVTIFLWRAKRNKKVEQDRLAVQMINDTEECGSGREFPEDQHSSNFVSNITDTDKILTSERPERIIPTRTRGSSVGRPTLADWNSCDNGQQQRGVEEHEIAHRLQAPQPCSPARY